MYYLVTWIGDIFNLVKGWKMIKKKNVILFT